MALLGFNEVTFGFAGHSLLEQVTVNIHRHERIGLVGRNGAGKSSLLRLIAGEYSPDSGTLIFDQSAKVAYLTQDVPANLGGTIFDCVADGLKDIGTVIAEFHRLDRKSHETKLTESEHTKLDQLVHRMGDEHAWDQLHQIERTLTEMDLDMDALFDTLSAGRKRRVLLARALVSQPDLLLLDEPTNHLDIDSIIWLQNFLMRFDGTIIFVTHDRAFLQDLATRIIEIERGRLFDWTCTYDKFVERRDEMLEAEVKQQALFDKRLAEEERWIRKGIKARRVRNEGRVRALKKMRTERHNRREKIGTVRMQVQEAGRSGRLVVRAKDLSFAYDEQPIVSKFSTEIFRGDKIGVIGPNGIGKTTLLKMLLGELKPDTGKIHFGTKLQVAYFDQLRDQLDDSSSVRDNVAKGADTIEINGSSKHVLGYLQDFLFTPDRAQLRVGLLSGGERNRLLLARLFTKPSNILVLDEPTNDLDTETLELLEELLTDYSGTVLLVSHDRAFLNNVVTSTMVFEGDGVIKEYDGGYDDWLRQRTAVVVETKPENKPKSKPALTSSKKDKVRKLTFNEKFELKALPPRIEELEAGQKSLHAKMMASDFYRQPGEQIAKVQAELSKLEEELADAYQRWELLESLAVD